MSRSIATVALAALVTVIANNSLLMAEEPLLEEAGNRWLIITRLPPLLEEEDVAPHLTKGLTTTFVFIVDLIGVPGGKKAGAARVEVRYELWDEVFHTTVLGVDGRLLRGELSSRDELLDWWSRLRLIAVDNDALATPHGQEARLTLEVVPFSRGEERDTQRWFAESVSSAELARNEGISASVDGTERHESGVFSVLIATSIRRRPLTSYNWTVEIVAPAER